MFGVSIRVLAFDAYGCLGAADAFYAVDSLDHQVGDFRYVLHLKGGYYVKCTRHGAGRLNTLNLRRLLDHIEGLAPFRVY